MTPVTINACLLKDLNAALEKILERTFDGIEAKFTLSELANQIDQYNPTRKEGVSVNIVLNLFKFSMLESKGWNVIEEKDGNGKEYIVCTPKYT